MTAGQEFVKKIGPLGSVLFLLIFVFTIVICFFPPKGGLSNYKPPQSSEYYAQSSETLAELKTELESNVFPHLGATIHADLSEGALIISTDADSMVLVKAALSEHFGNELFVFVEE